MRNDSLIYIGSDAFSKETLLVQLDNLEYLRRVNPEKTISENLNNILKESLNGLSQHQEI